MSPFEDQNKPPLLYAKIINTGNVPALDNNYLYKYNICGCIQFILALYDADERTQSLEVTITFIH